MKRASVITSYSIHYTKLYDVLICGVVPQINIYAEPKDETEAKMTPEEYFKTLTPKAVLERANKDIRITSYNVCYTKLLR